MRGICLIYNDITGRPGAKIDSQKLVGIFHRLGIFGERLLSIETRDQMYDPEEDIEADITRNLKNLSCDEDIDIIIAWDTKTFIKRIFF